MARHRHGYYPFTDASPRRRTRCVDVGPTACLAPTQRGGELAGFIFGHDAPDLPVRCDGSLMVIPLDQHPIWSMTETLEAGDLTLSPSVLCRRDGFHGWVRAGQWVSA